MSISRMIRRSSRAAGKAMGGSERCHALRWGWCFAFTAIAPWVVGPTPAHAIVAGINIDVHQDVFSLFQNPNDFHIEGRIESGEPDGSWSDPPVLIEHIDDIFPNFTYSILPDASDPSGNWYLFQADWSFPDGDPGIPFCTVLHLGVFFDVTCRNVVIDLVGWWTRDGVRVSGFNDGYYPLIGFRVEDDPSGLQYIRLQNGRGGGGTPVSEIDMAIVQMDLVALSREELHATLGREVFEELNEGGLQNDLPWIPVYVNGEPISEIDPWDFPAESFFDVVLNAPPGPGPYPVEPIMLGPDGFLISRQGARFINNTQEVEYRWYWEIHGAHPDPPPPPPPPPGLVVGFNVDVHQDLDFEPWPNDFHVEGRIESSTFPVVADQINDIFPFWNVQIMPDVEEGWYTFTADWWGAEVPFCTVMHIGLFFEVTCHNVMIDMVGWWTWDGMPVGPVPIPGFDVQDRINQPPNPLGQVMRLQNDGDTDTQIYQMMLAAMSREDLLDPSIGLGPQPFRELRLGGLESQLPWTSVVHPDGTPVSEANPINFDIDSFFDVFFEIPQEGGLFVENPIAVPPGGFLIAKELQLFTTPAGTEELRWTWEIHGAHEELHDLGDAPDSTNSWGIGMTAYAAGGGPPGTAAHYPTVYQAGSPPHGPIHWFPRAVAWLGPWVTLEQEADIGFDEDPTNNIIPPNDAPDLDLADDSIAFPISMPHCQPTTLTYTVNVVAPGIPLYVNVFADWNRDGDWDDALSCPGGVAAANEWAIQNQVVNFAAAGLFPVVTPVFLPWHPPGAVAPQPIWLRITISEQPYDPVSGVAGSGGAGPSWGYDYGETEDYYFIPDIPQQELDFGDAPDPTYPTLLVNDGARHVIFPGFHLGAGVDPEADGQPNLFALGDDMDGNDDEDGVVFTSPLQVGRIATVDVTATAPGVLDAWVDFGGDGSWAQPGDQIFAGTPLAAGVNSLSFTVPAGASVGGTYARFRFSSGLVAMSYTGLAPDGEVEDYLVSIEEAPVQFVKWSQPPVPAAPDNVFYGWNEFSSCCGTMVADDWYCDTDDAVYAIRWWGSFKEWKGTTPPPEPFDHFRIGMWTDVPDTEAPNCCQCWDNPPNPPRDDCSQGVFDEAACMQMGAGYDQCEFHEDAYCDTANKCTPGFSHPGTLIHEIMAFDYNWQWVGWDYDPRTNEYESAFLFEYTLQPNEYFHQKPGGNIYWLSIGAGYCGVPPGPNPWGWKTVPRDSTSLAPDDAVIMPNPGMICPFPGSTWEEVGGGNPIYWPTDAESWDMAFEIVGRSALSEIKWGQPPDPQWPGLHAHDYDVGSGYTTITLADQFVCEGGDIHDLHWYGNYELDADDGEKRGSGIQGFLLSLHANVPGNPWCLPGSLLWSGYVPFAAAMEQDTGLVNNEGSTIYHYRYFLPDPYPQTAGETYWFDLIAISREPTNPPIWRWQEAGRNETPTLCPAAEQLGPIPSPWRSIEWTNFDPPRYSDMAFDITSMFYGELAVKWSQPPQSYIPENAYMGWNELSMYGAGMPQIVADDWFCDTDSPVTDVHWWGSHLGWSEKGPPHLPNAFHIGIWTDVQDDPNADFSHPGTMIHEYRCEDYVWTFDGWDFDPRNAAVAPEAAYKYRCDLPEASWFYQEPGGNIYWVSIAAVYDNGIPAEHPWGWKTRPRDADSAAPDDAVVIFDPTAPHVVPFPPSAYQAGAPLWWPTPNDSWDTAFELTSLAVCDPSSTPIAETMPNAGGVLVVSEKNRALSFTAGDPGKQQAIRVTFVSLPSPFHVWNGAQLWVGEPYDVCEIGGVADPGGCGSEPLFTAAKLDCDDPPHFTDWSAVGLVHVYHEGIVPDGTYRIEVIEEDCDRSDPSSYSPPLNLDTTLWGDVCGAYVPGAGVNSWSAPDGSKDVPTDFLSVIDKFRGTAAAPIKARADVEPGCIDHIINITDAVEIIDAFRGLPYRFGPPSAANPCDSTCP